MNRNNPISIKLAYIANIRLPTEKAHGYQIMQMCRAFAHQQTMVTLFHPQRYQTPQLKSLQGVDAFNYYDIPPEFKIHTLRNIDVIHWENRLPGYLKRVFIWAQAIGWGYTAVKKAQKWGATIFYTRDIQAAYLLTKLQLPTIYECHGIPGGRLLSLLKRVVIAPSLLIGVVLTSFIKQALMELGATSDRLIVSPDAIDLDSYANIPAKAESRIAVGLPTDRPIIGYIGRFHTMGHEKGISELIRAVAAIYGQMEKPPLLVCVGGPMDSVSGYLKLADQLHLPQKAVRFVDRVPNKEVVQWLSTFDIAAMPFPFTTHYAYYMSPMKLFEYMGAGKAIISSDLPSIREILTHNHNAWFVQPDNPDQLSDGIKYLLEHQDVATRLGQQAKQDVQAYSWNNRAATILQAYNKVGAINGA